MPTAVLLSGGLDSAVLVAEEAAAGEVQPIYVSVGLAWEAAERAIVVELSRARAAQRPGAAARLAQRRHARRLRRDALGDRGTSARRITRRTRTCICRDATSILLGKAAVYCAAAKIDRLVIGTLAHNPFPDATPEFRAAMARALSLGLDRPLQIDAPYADTEQGRRHPPRRGARRPVRADAVVHEPALQSAISSLQSRTALRRVQQVPRAPRCLRRGRHRRPHDLRLDDQPPLTRARPPHSRIMSGGPEAG